MTMQYVKKELNNVNYLRDTHSEEIRELVQADPYLAAVQLHSMAIDLHNTRMHMASVTRKILNNTEWWKTYRASLTGKNGTPEEAHEEAKRAADLAHGKLQEIKEEPFPQ